RVADTLVQQGRVTINGRIAVLGDQVQADDVVRIDGRVLAQDRPAVYLAYHKPVGVTSTTELHVKDNIIHAVGYPERIFPIGRMCSALGYRVTALVRNRIMGIVLGELEPGQWRALSGTERRELLSAVGRTHRRAVS